MKFEHALNLVLAELERAETLHPDWPRDQVHQAAIVAEEAGELVRASLNHHYEKGPQRNMVMEAVHTAAVALRFLSNIEAGEDINLKVKARE